ncbi:phosphatase PAP2 family protein [Leifsonia sp. Le1]|uniref:phosphatase PAP2 family protein n=1 Tax=Leifsonia sp. Le1 TaxID=3404918 RepID=UPI003EBCD1C3
MPTVPLRTAVLAALPTVPQRVLFASAVALSALVLVMPFPGSLSVVATRWLVAVSAGVPGVGLLSEVALVALAAGVAAAIVLGWRRQPANRVRVVALVVSVGIAYAASESIKLLVTELRPCQRWPLAEECAPLGDWSFPSNHATLAFAAAAVIAVLSRRFAVMAAAFGCAVLVAFDRVAQGAHYLHDVAAGAVLGLGMVVVALVCAALVLRWRPSARQRERDAST